MDENQGCPSTLPGRVQLPDNKGAISIQSPLHPCLCLSVRPSVCLSVSVSVSPSLPPPPLSLSLSLCSPLCMAQLHWWMVNVHQMHSLSLAHGDTENVDIATADIECGKACPKLRSMEQADRYWIGMYHRWYGAPASGMCLINNKSLTPSWDAPNNE